MDERHLEIIIQGVVAVVCCGIGGFIALIASVAFFGPLLAPLMNKLPW